MMRTDLKAHTGIGAFALALPDDLTALSEEELANLLEAGTSEFDGILDEAGEAPNAEQLAAMRDLAAQIGQLRGETDRRAQEASAAADEIAGLRNAVHPPAADPDGGAPVDAPPADAPPVEAPVAVAASGSPVVPRPALPTGVQPPAGTPTRAPAVLLASAGLTDHAPGSQVSMLQAAEIFTQRARSFPKYGTPGRQVAPIVSIHTPYPENLIASADDQRRSDAAIRLACDESRLPGGSLIAARSQNRGSLTAAGTGWCAPSQTLYDVPSDGATLAGVLDLPETGMERGGIRFTLGVDFATVYAGTGFQQTEAQNISGVAKTINTVPCPASFTDVRAQAIGFAVKSGILQQSAFPETIAQFLDQVVIAHEHRVSAFSIAQMVAGSTDMGTSGTAVAASVMLLDVLDLQATDMRARHVMDPEQTIEVVLPEWIIGVFRADYSKRNAVDLPLEVTRAMIVNWLAIRNIAAQFTWDFQTFLTQPIGGDTGADAVRIGNDPTTTPIVAWPDRCQVLMYPAGTWVRAREDVISINGLYDLALLTDNKELAVFTEQGILVAKRGFDSRKFTVPLLPNGQSGAQVAFTGNL